MRFQYHLNGDLVRLFMILNPHYHVKSIFIVPNSCWTSRFFPAGCPCRKPAERLNGVHCWRGDTQRETFAEAAMTGESIGIPPGNLFHSYMENG